MTMFVSNCPLLKEKKGKEKSIDKIRRIFFEGKNHVTQFAVMFEEGIYNFPGGIF